MIIGLVGFLGSGKGTVGEILENFGFKTESFAGHVKDIASTMFIWPRWLLEGDTEKSRIFRESPCPFWSDKMGRPFTPREALQKIGTEVGRDIFDKDFWVHSLENRIDMTQNYVITDVRFPNEIEWIRKNNGIIVEIQRGENPEWYNQMVNLSKHFYMTKEKKIEFMKKYNVHESEWSWIGSNMDFLIKNDGTKQDLEFKINYMLTVIQNHDKLMPKSTQLGEANEAVH